MYLHDRYYDETTQIAEINLPREDLANIIGTARESLGRFHKGDALGEKEVFQIITFLKSNDYSLSFFDLK